MAFLLVAYSGTLAAAPKAAAPNRAKPGATAAPRKPAPAGPGVREMFTAAQKLYDAGKFPQALSAYDAILHRFPEHLPTIIQYAKTLYRMDRIVDSYSMFARINPSTLDEETSYEFGWAFFVNKQWEGALYAFRRVPAGHAFYDLANYYGALCAIRLRRYAEAEELLDQAVVLPDKLAKSRSLYQKHVAELKLMQERAALAKERDAEKNRIQSESQGGQANAGAAAKPAVAGPPKPGQPNYAHGGFKSVSKSASLNYSSIIENQDKHGYGERNATVREGEFAFAHGLLVPLPIQIGPGRFAGIGLPLKLSALDRLTDGRQQRYIATEEDPDLVRVVSTPEGRSHEKIGVFNITPWVELPIPHGMWAGLSSDFKFEYPDFERGGRYGTRNGSGFFGAKLPNSSVLGVLGRTEVLDSETNPIVTSNNFDLTYKLTVAEPTSLEFVMKYRGYEYLIENRNGPDSSTSLAATATQTLPLGFTISVNGGFEAQANAVFFNMPTYGSIAADGEIFSGEFSLGLNPIKWFEGSATYAVAKSNWHVDNAEAQDTFERNVPNFTQTTTLKASLLFPM